MSDEADFFFMGGLPYEAYEMNGLDYRCWLGSGAHKRSMDVYEVSCSPEF